VILYVAAMCWIISTVPSESRCQEMGAPRSTLAECQLDVEQLRRVERHGATWAVTMNCVPVGAPVYREEPN
jgi:hypothetical protein